MSNRPLEDILWGDFRVLDETLQSNCYGVPWHLGNGYVLYEVRKPDTTLPLNGKYLAVRKSTGSRSLESAFLLDCPNSTEASSLIMKLAANQPVKHAPYWLKEACRISISGSIGAIIAATLAQDSSAAVPDFVVGASIFGVGAAIYMMFPSAVAFYSGLVRANSGHGNGPKGVSGGVVEGKEALVEMLYLTEIHSARV